MPGPPVRTDQLGMPEHSSTGSDITSARPRRRLVQAFTMWLAIYPALTLALWLFEHLGLWQLPLPLRALILTVVLVPTMVYVLIPAITNALRLAMRVGSSARTR